MVFCGSAGKRWLQVSVSHQGCGTIGVSFSTESAWGPEVHVYVQCAHESVPVAGLASSNSKSSRVCSLANTYGNSCGIFSCQLSVPGAFLAAEEESVTSISGHCVSPVAFTSLTCAGG